MTSLPGIWAITKRLTNCVMRSESRSFNEKQYAAQQTAKEELIDRLGRA